MDDTATTLYYRLLRWQNVYRRYVRYIFPSPAELRLIELMGGKVFRVRWLRQQRTGFCFAIVLNMGRIFNKEKVRREVGYGRYWVDFANDLNRIIEVDGDAYHMDVVADFDRELFIKEYCKRTPNPAAREARILRIKASELYRNPNNVQQKVLGFLYG